MKYVSKLGISVDYALLEFLLHQLKINDINCFKRLSWFTKCILYAEKTSDGSPHKTWIGKTKRMKKWNEKRLICGFLQNIRNGEYETIVKYFVFLHVLK